MYVKSEREMTMYIHIYVEIEVVKEEEMQNCNAKRWTIE